MKNILKLLLASFIFLTAASCKKNNETSHELAWNESGNDSIVKVQSYDNNGNLLEYYMYYTIFNNLFNRGGYGAVNNYYSEHRSSLDRNYGNYTKRYTQPQNPKQFYSSPSNYKTSTPVRNTESYKKSSPTIRSKSNSYSTSSPSRYNSTSTSSYKSSSPSRSSYNSSSSGSSYKSSSSSSSSYRSSSPSSSSNTYRSSSPSGRR